MPHLEIRLLGQFQVQLGGEILSGFVSDKARALLAYLATEGHIPQRRETLAHLLWPGKSESRARANLRCTLANLRKVIGEAHATPPYLFVTRHDIKIHPDSHAWMDIDVLTQLHHIETVTEENVGQFDAVFDLYQGEFLTGFNLPDSLPFDEWALIKREGYTRMADAILRRVSNYYENKGDCEAAIPFAWRHVELEPWQENARRQLMRLLMHTGRRDEALQQYLDLESALESILKIKPGIKTKQLYESILEGRDIVLPSIRTAPGHEQLPIIPAFLQEKEVRAVTPAETFVARQDELERLQDQLDGVMAGRGGFVMVAGEAGSGKTMLVREFMQQAQSDYTELVSAAGYCNAFTGVGDPYLPFREILYQLSGDIEAQWKAGSISRQNALNLWNTIPITCQALRTYGPDLIDTLLPAQTLLELTASYAQTRSGGCGDLLSYLQDRHQGTHREIQQANLFSQFIDVLQRISEHSPLLLFVDDLQWADAGTIGMLSQFIKHIERSRILLIGAYRSEEVGVAQGDQRHPLSPVLHEIQRNYGDVLVNLDLSSGRDFINELIMSEPNDLPEAFCEQLYLLTGGNALFTIELLRSLQDAGVLVKDGRGMWVLCSDLHLERLPPQTEGVIAQRVSRLPQDLQHILTLASVEGEVFTAEIIAAIAQQPVEGVIFLLSDLLDKQHRLVRPQQVSQQGNQSISIYRFRHFLFQNYLYHQLDGIQRTRLHGQVGREMERIAGESKVDYAVHLARHFNQAQHAEKACGYYTLAGERAVRMSAYPEAVKHFEAALDMLLLLPENPARNEQELDLQLQLGRAYQATVGYAHQKVGKAYQRAWEICQSGGDTIKRITTIQLLTSYYMNIANFKTSELMMKHLVEIIGEMEEVPPEFKLHPRLGYSYLYSLYGKHQAVVHHAEQAIKYYNQVVQHTSGERIGLEVGIFCHGWAGLHQNWLGYPEKAQGHILSIQKIAEGYNSKLFNRDALWFSAWISLEMGNIAAARDFANDLLALTIREGYFFYEAAARDLWGRILSHAGEHKAAIASIQKGLEMFYQTGSVASQTVWMHDLAEAYCADGQVEDGLAVILRAEQVENDTGEARCKSALQRIKGDLYRLRGDEDAAEKAYGRAIDVARADGTKLLELEAVKRLASLWHEQGKGEEGLQMLREVYDWFTEGFDTPMLVEARALMEDLSH